MKLEEIEKAMATIIECHHESNRNIQALYDALVETIRADGNTGLVKADNKAHHEAEERINHEKTVNNFIKKHKKAGFTYKEIAESLNDGGYKTFSGKGLWHAQTIHRIYRNYKYTTK